MKKAKPQFCIFLKEQDGSRFAVTSPMESHLLDDWYAVAEGGGSALVVYEVRPEQVMNEKRLLSESGLKEVAAGELVSPPVDRANHFVGNLPAYASGADRSLIVSILCRDCRTTRWAVLNKPYPGEKPLKDAGMFDYRATCLKCNYQASDNYKWSRG